MNIIDNFRNGIKSYIQHCIEVEGITLDDYKKEFSVQDIKCMFLCDAVYEITTYDNSLSIEFGKSIIEVMNVIFERNNFEYIKKNKDNYKKFIIVANILDEYGWIEWGTSIRSCWFDYGNIIINDYLKICDMAEIIINNDKDIADLLYYLESEEL